MTVVALGNRRRHGLRISNAANIGRLESLLETMTWTDALRRLLQEEESGGRSEAVIAMGFLPAEIIPIRGSSALDNAEPASAASLGPLPVDRSAIPRKMLQVRPDDRFESMPAPPAKGSPKELGEAAAAAGEADNFTLSPLGWLCLGLIVLASFVSALAIFRSGIGSALMPLAGN